MLRIFTLLLLFACGAPSFAQDASLIALTIPAELREDAKSVVREYHQTYKAFSPRESTLSVRRVVTLLDDGHKYQNRLVVHYDNDTKITRFKATLYDAFGKKIRDAKKSEIEDISAISGGQFYTDSRVRTVTMTHQTYPYTVEFEYDLNMKDFGGAASPAWRPITYGQSAQHTSFTAYVHDGNELQYRANQVPEPVTSREGNYTVLRWQLDDLTARRSEEEAPPATETLPFLHTSLRDFTVDEYQLTNANWGAFGKQMLQLHQDIRTVPPALAEEIAAVTEGLTTDREKVNALYAFMQQRTRYVGVQLGIGGWQPFSAEYVEQNRFGDCKALSNYMGAMLDEVGIENYPVLVHWSDQPPVAVEPDFTATAFNHMILYVPGEDMYLECTSDNLPAGYLGDGKQDRNVLWLTPEGGKLVKTPAHVAGEHGHVRAVELEVGADGVTKFNLRAGYFGANHERLRSLLHQVRDPAERLRYLHREGELPDVSGTDFTFNVPDDEPRLDLAYRTELPKYARKLGKRMFLPLNKLYRFDRVPDKVAERRFPIVSSEAMFLVDTVRMTIPENMEVESLGEAEIRYEHAVGEYRSEVISAPGSLTWVRTLKLVPATLPPTAYEGYRQFFVDVSKAERRQVVLREKRTK